MLIIEGPLLDDCLASNRTEVSQERATTLAEKASARNGSKLQSFSLIVASCNCRHEPALNDSTFAL
jgi:hypothetical protein